MKNEPRPFSKFLLDLLRDDPEWASYVASLSPNIPLRRAVEEYLRFVKERLGLTPEEIEAADRILALMQELIGGLPMRWPSSGLLPGCRRHRFARMSRSETRLLNSPVERSRKNQRKG